jgi:hypothetical protein
MGSQHRDDDDPAWLAAVRADWAAAAELIEPPAWVRERARRLLAARPSGPRRLLQRLKGTLIFDSRRSGLARAGVRSIGPFDPDPLAWQLLFRGGDVDVDLLVRPNQDGRTMHVRGQALSLGGDGVGAGVVEAQPIDIPRPLRGAAPTVRSEVDSSGEFALPDLAHGRYSVLLRFGAREIELSDVEL